MARKRRTGSEEEKSVRALLKSLTLGSAVGTIVFFLLLCALSLFVLRTGVSQKILLYLGIAAAALSAFCAGFAGVRGIGKNGLVMGLCAMLPELLVIVLTVLFTSSSLGLTTLVMAAAMAAASAGGGVLAVNTR